MMFVQYVGGTSWRKVDYRSRVGGVAFLRTSVFLHFFFVAGWKASNGGNHRSWRGKTHQKLSPPLFLCGSRTFKITPPVSPIAFQTWKDPLWKIECWAEPFKFPGRVAVAFFSTFVAGWESEVDACTKLIWWNHYKMLFRNVPFFGQNFARK